ncbi:MAG: Hsp20/alpha crystallin family protein [Halochromatium sp.]|uniref:Hsp20/alpha crystallin family protein n=1 Tax=Halochromatium sp. TaxID=2049430 RepID=UPI0039781E13
MPTNLQQFRENVTDTWGRFVQGWSQGWNELSHRAAGAMTRFWPKSSGTGARDKHEQEQHALRSSGWGVLAAEVLDEEDRIRVRLEAPGMKKEDFNLTVLDNCLLIHGEKHVEDERSEGRYRVMERAYGAFERSIPLPAMVDIDRAQARYERGVLRVELPKTAPEQRRRVAVD